MSQGGGGSTPPPNPQGGGTPGGGKPGGGSGSGGGEGGKPSSKDFRAPGGASGGGAPKPGGGATPPKPGGAGGKPGAKPGGKDGEKPGGVAGGGKSGSKEGAKDSANNGEKSGEKPGAGGGGDGKKPDSRGEAMAREAGKQGGRAAKEALDKKTAGATKIIPKKAAEKLGGSIGVAVFRAPKYVLGTVFLLIIGILSGGAIAGNDAPRMATAFSSLAEFKKIPEKQSAAYRRAVKAVSRDQKYGGEIPWGLVAAVAELTSEHGKISPYLDDLCDRNPDQPLQRGRVGISKTACPAGVKPSSFPVVTPAIGGSVEKKQAATGPFLLLPGVLAENKGVDPQSMQASDRFSTPRTATELVVKQMDDIRKRMVDKEGRKAPAKGDAKAAREFWGEVLARLPIADPTAIGCKPASVGVGSSKDQVAVAVSTTWRCELQQREVFLYQGRDGAVRIKEDAVAEITAEALGVAWLFSKYGTSGTNGCTVTETTNQNGTKTKSVTVVARDDQPAGVFPLDKKTFEAWADPSQLSLGRCDSGANITAAVRAFMSEEAKPWDEREGEWDSKAAGGWGQMPWILGSDAARTSFKESGVFSAFDPLGADKVCAAAVVEWVAAMRANSATFTGLEVLTRVSEANPDTNQNGLPDALEAKSAELAAAIGAKDPRGRGRPCKERADGSVERYASVVAYDQQTVKINSDGTAGDVGASESDTLQDPTSTTTTTLPPSVADEAVADDFYTPEKQAQDATLRGVVAYMEKLADIAPASSTLEVRPGEDAVVQRLSANGRWGVEVPWPSVPATTYVSQALMFAQALSPLVEDDPDHKAEPTVEELQTVLDLILPTASMTAAGGSIAGIPSTLIDAISKSVEVGKKMPENSRCTADTALLLAMSGTEAPGAWKNIQPDGSLVPRYVDPGVAERGDNDKGLLDGDAENDHAIGIFGMTVGSMIGYKKWYPNVDPLDHTTWSPNSYGWGADGNQDGVVDPFNIYDEALMSYRMFCRNAGGKDLVGAFGPEFVEALGAMLGGGRWNSDEPRDCYGHEEYPTWRLCTEWLAKKKYDKAALYRAQLSASFTSFGTLPAGVGRAIAWARSEIAAKRPYTGTSSYRFGQPWGNEPAPLKSTFPNSTNVYWFPAGTVSYDCSGFATRFWQEAGVNLMPLHATSSYTMQGVLPHVGLDMSKWQPGDLLISDSYPENADGTAGDGRADHVMVYVGDGKMVQSSFGKGANEAPIPDWKSKFAIKWVVRPVVTNTGA